MTEDPTPTPYEIVERLGADERATCYRVRVAQGAGCERRHLLSVLQPHVASSPEARAAFASAIRGQAGLVDPRLVAPVDAAIDVARPFRVTPLVEGWSLASLLGEPPHGAPPLTASACAWIVLQLAEALGSERDGAGGRFVHGALELGSVHVTPEGAVRGALPLLDASSSAPSPRDDVRAAAGMLQAALAGLPSRPGSGPRAPDSSPLRALLDPALSANDAVGPQDLADLASALRSLPVHVGAGHVARLTASLPRGALRPVGAPAASRDTTTVQDAAGAAREALPDGASLEGPPRPPRPPRLRLLTGARPTELVLSAGADRWVVGRGRGADLVVDDPDVSREHLEILRTRGQLRVFDLGSKNGLLVNDVPVDEHLLEAGDRLSVGTSMLRFEP